MHETQKAFAQKTKERSAELDAIEIAKREAEENAYRASQTQEIAEAEKRQLEFEKLEEVLDVAHALGPIAAEHIGANYMVRLWERVKVKEAGRFSSAKYETRAVASGWLISDDIPLDASNGENTNNPHVSGNSKFQSTLLTPGGELICFGEAYKNTVEPYDEPNAVRTYKSNPTKNIDPTEPYVDISQIRNVTINRHEYVEPYMDHMPDINDGKLPVTTESLDAALVNFAAIYELPVDVV